MFHWKTEQKSIILQVAPLSRRHVLDEGAPPADRQAI